MALVLVELLLQPSAPRREHGDLGSENELCWVFAGSSDRQPQPNSHEIAAVRWIAPVDLDREFETNPEIFTPWFTMEWVGVRKVFREKLGL